MVEVHVPPKYNERGNKQLLIVETGNQKIDDPVNGFLTAVIVIGPLAIARGLL